MTVTISDKSIKRVFGAAVIVALLAVVVLQTNLMTGNAARKVGFTSAIVEVVPNATSMPSSGPFYMEGSMYAQGGVNPATGRAFPGEPSIGTWRAWGFKFEGSRASVSESYELDAFLGTIQGQGTVDLADTPATQSVIQAVERNDALGVSGGTGSFSGAQGTGQMRVLNTTTGAFRVTFAQAGERPGGGSSSGGIGQ
jgi:hypothetical protein